MASLVFAFVSFTVVALFCFLSIRFISVLVITCFLIWVLINFWVLFDFIVGFSGVLIYLFVCLTR
jgi:hypothetical protein